MKYLELYFTIKNLEPENINLNSLLEIDTIYNDTYKYKPDLYISTINTTNNDIILTPLVETNFIRIFI